MTTKTKNNALRFAVAALAVLLLCGAVFAGAVSATDISSRADYLTTFGSPTLDAGSYYIKGSWEIPSLHNGTDSLAINGNVFLDFTNFTGTFAGNANAAENNVGALFGNLTYGDNSYELGINGIRMSYVIVNASGYDGIGGIIGNANGNHGTIRLNDCHLNNVSVNGNGDVGGLLGITESPNVDFYVTNCTIEHSNILGSAPDIGGLFGSAGQVYLEGGCAVINSTIASTGRCVGGMVGDAKVITAIANAALNIRVENTSIVGRTDCVGGIVGGVWWWTGTFAHCIVKNCAIIGAASGDNYIGGLVGSVDPWGDSSALGIRNCTIENCTIYGDGYVGGLLGNVGGDDISSRCDDNKVLNTAVRGGTPSLVIAGKAWSADCDTSQGVNYLSPSDTISIMNQTGGDCISDSNLWKNISYTTGLKSGSSLLAIVTNLGRYSTSTGFGVIMYIVSIDTPENGLIDASPKAVFPGNSVTVTAYPKPGYHVDKTYWYKTGEFSKNPIQMSGTVGSFSIPSYDVTINGSFAANTTKVTFYNTSLNGNDKIVKYNTFGNPADVLGNLEKSGYKFNRWNATVDAGLNWWEFSNNQSFVKTLGNIWNYTGADEGNLAVVANWSVNTTNVIATGNKAEFHYDNVTAIYSTTGNVQKVLLENLSGVSNTAVNFTAGITIGDMPDISNHIKDEITVFEINASIAPGKTTAQFNVTVTFADEATATAEISKVRFWHYNTANNAWDTPELTILAKVQTGEKVMYTVETTSFSPFGFGIYTPVPSPAPQSSSHSSRNDGYSVWLQETAQPTPTPVPIAEPTQAVPVASPVAQPTQTSASPAPFVGILAGLGAAAVFFGMRRK